MFGSFTYRLLSLTALCALGAIHIIPARGGFVVCNDQHVEERIVALGGTVSTLINATAVICVSETLSIDVLDTIVLDANHAKITSLRWLRVVWQLAELQRIAYLSHVRRLEVERMQCGIN